MKMSLSLILGESVSLSKLPVTSILYLARPLQLPHELAVAPNPPRLEVLLRLPDTPHRLPVPKDVEGLYQLLKEGVHPKQEGTVLVGHNGTALGYQIHRIALPRPRY